MIIVLKMRTRVEGGYKVEETAENMTVAGAGAAGRTTYNFSGGVGEDTGFEATAPSSAPLLATDITGTTVVAATKATVKPADNGFYTRHVLNTKPGGRTKPVREWYV